MGTEAMTLALAKKALAAKETYCRVHRNVESLEGYLGETLAYLLGAILTDDVIALDLENPDDAAVYHIFMDAKIPAQAWKCITLEGCVIDNHPTKTRM